MWTSSTAAPAATEGRRRPEPRGTSASVAAACHLHSAPPADVGDEAGMPGDRPVEELFDLVQIVRGPARPRTVSRVALIVPSPCGGQRSSRRRDGTGVPRIRSVDQAPDPPRPGSANARREVRVRLPTREHAAEKRHDPVEPEREEGLQRPARLRDLEDREPAAGAEDAPKLDGAAREVGDVAMPKPTVAASKLPSAKGSASTSPCTHSIVSDLRRARTSISPEKSSPVTMPPSRSAAIARSPVPQHASRTGRRAGRPPPR